MSLTEIIPAVDALPRSEKFRLVRLLLDDLAQEDLLSGLKQGQEFPIYTPSSLPKRLLSLRCFSKRKRRMEFPTKSGHGVKGWMIALVALS